MVANVEVQQKRNDREVLRFIESVFDKKGLTEEWFKADDPLNRLQDIKKGLKNREYMEVFLSSEEHLMTYFAFYVPSRVMCYYSLFTEHLSGVITGRNQMIELELQRRRQKRRTNGTVLDKSESADSAEVMCIGAGAGSELLAFSLVIFDQLRGSEGSTLSLEALDKMTFTDYQEWVSKNYCPSSINLTMIDIANWHSIFNTLQEHLDDELFSSLKCDVKTQFLKDDILALPDSPKLQGLCGACSIVTFAFVLNELFTESKQKTIKMISSLLKNLKKGTLLLFLESAGSISELEVGNKPVMVFQLLDKIASLENIYSNDSQWYRYDASLDDEVPYTLNNMRFFIRLYRFKGL